MMRKFLFSSAMIGVVAGGWNVYKSTRKGPRDWRLLLQWIGWGLSAAVAVGDVVKDARQREIEAASR